MKTIAVAVAILSAGFMQDVSGSFLKKTEEKKDAQPGVAEADAFAAAAAFAKLAKHADASAGHRHNADKMVEEKTDIEADEKHMDNEKTDIEADAGDNEEVEEDNEAADREEDNEADEQDENEQDEDAKQQAAKRAAKKEHAKEQAIKRAVIKEAAAKEQEAAAKEQAASYESLMEAAAKEQAAKSAAEKADAKEQAPEGWGTPKRVAEKADDIYTEGDKLGMKKALKKLAARVNVLTERARKADASDADKLIAKSGKKALKAASKQDQAMRAKIRVNGLAKERFAWPKK